MRKRQRITQKDQTIVCHELGDYKRITVTNFRCENNAFEGLNSATLKRFPVGNFTHFFAISLSFL